jgi:hypothetical protein
MYRCYAQGDRRFGAASDVYRDDLGLRAAIDPPDLDTGATMPETATHPERIETPLGAFRLIPAGKHTIDGRTVTITRPYYLAETPIIQRVYRDVCGKTPSYFKGDDHPVESVSWLDAQAFLRRASERDGIPYRLPTEAEWERAALGGTGAEDAPSTYAGGEDIDAVAWHSGNSERQTHPVGQKKPNGYGLFDMTGNVWEWCADEWDAAGPRGTDPHRAENDASGSDRVSRGGSWLSVPVFARVALRYWDTPGDRWSTLGLRAAVDVPAPAPTDTRAPEPDTAATREAIARYLDAEAQLHLDVADAEGHPYHARMGRRIAALARMIREGAPDADV